MSKEELIRSLVCDGAAHAHSGGLSEEFWLAMFMMMVGASALAFFFALIWKDKI